MLVSPAKSLTKNYQSGRLRTRTMSRMAVAGHGLDEIRVCMMFRRFGPANDVLEDISRVEGLVRERFRIEDSEIILVSEDPGVKPGFPPLETNVIFWKHDKRYRVKIFSPF